MANAIQIKRRSSSGSSGAPSASALKWGELAFNEADNTLYYGYGSGNDQALSVPSIGGSGAYSLRGGTNASGTWPISITGNSNTVTNGVYTSRTLSAGSGLVGGGDLSVNRTFDIGQGDGITVSSDSISVNNTVVRTTGVQTINGQKTFNNILYLSNTSQIYFEGLTVGVWGARLEWDYLNNKFLYQANGNNSTFFDINGYLNTRTPTSNSGTSHIAIFANDPSISASGQQTIYSRNISDFKSDISLNNVTNNAQVKKISSTTVGNVPTWSVTTGDELSTGYSVETSTLSGSSSALARADVIKSYVDNAISAGFNANDAMQFKGVVTNSSGLPTTTVSAGWTYRVGEAGTYAGQVCEIGDMIIAVSDALGSSNSTWSVVQTNIDGAVLSTRNINTGNGLTGGGNLSTDRTLSVVASSGLTADSNGVHVGVGYGLNIYNDYLDIDTTEVVVTTGNQTIAGVKTFSSTISGSIDGNAATVTNGVYTSRSINTTSPLSGGGNLSSDRTLSLASGYGDTQNPYGSKAANYVLASPDGSTGAPSFRALVSGDIPNLDTSKLTSGTLSVLRGGTGQSSYTNGQLLIGNTTGNTLTKATLTQGTGIGISNGAGSITISHEDTSSLSGAQGSNGIASITLDGFGHVTAVTTATYVTSASLCSSIANCPIDGGTF